MFVACLLGKGLGTNDKRAYLSYKSLALDEGFRVNILESSLESCRDLLSKQGLVSNLSSEF